MPTYRFKQVDVFTQRPLLGNPVAVVLDAEGIDSEMMQRIAHWTNLSETTFLLPPTVPETSYRLRIFTPQHELPFAGHPTIGSAHAALEAGVVSGESFRMECGAGVLALSVRETNDGRRIAVEAPEASFVREFGGERDAITSALGMEVLDEPMPSATNNGPVWLFARLEISDTIAKLKPDMAAIVSFSREHGITGIAPYAVLDGDGPQVHIRCFAPASGVPEDPVTGSANAALPAHLAHAGALDLVGREYMATQGRELGRDGRVYVRVLDDAGRAEIGGHAVTVVEGEIRL